MAEWLAHRPLKSLIGGAAIPPSVISARLTHKYVTNFVTRRKLTHAMSTKYVESEAQVTSLVLIEGIAEIKRL